MKHAILLKPNSNIPYFSEMKRLCIYELQFMLETHQVSYDDIAVRDIAFASYLTFESDVDIRTIATEICNLSFFYAYFEIHGVYLKPIALQTQHSFPPDLSSRLKYSGKTNETFTRFLLNLTLWTCIQLKSSQKTFDILDPMCGKGTTLFEGLILGHNVFGVEQDRQSVLDGIAYFTRYLKLGKYKHRYTKNKRNLGETFDIQLGKNKQDIKQKIGQRLHIIRGNTLDTQSFFPTASMDAIICDLPYGIQHQSKNVTKKSRHPMHNNFFTAVLQSWLPTLKEHGVITLSWNTRTLPKKRLLETLVQQGLVLMDSLTKVDLAHRVSQAIQRDLIVAYKPPSQK